MLPRCLYKPRRPFKTFLDHVIEGGQGPETQQQVPFAALGIRHELRLMGVLPIAP